MLVGLSFYGDPFDTSGVWTEENHIGRTWQRLMSYLEQHGVVGISDVDTRALTRKIRTEGAMRAPPRDPATAE